jgi:hypothetical protein
MWPLEPMAVPLLCQDAPPLPIAELHFCCSEPKNLWKVLLRVSISLLDLQISPEKKWLQRPQTYLDFHVLLGLDMVVSASILNSLIFLVTVCVCVCVCVFASQSCTICRSLLKKKSTKLGAEEDNFHVVLFYFFIILDSTSERKHVILVFLCLANVTYHGDYFEGFFNMSYFNVHV